MRSFVVRLASVVQRELKRPIASKSALRLKTTDRGGGEKNVTDNGRDRS